MKVEKLGLQESLKKKSKSCKGCQSLRKSNNKMITPTAVRVALKVVTAMT